MQISCNPPKVLFLRIKQAHCTFLESFASAGSFSNKMKSGNTENKFHALARYAHRYKYAFFSKTYDF